jgi:hypothetical protein
MPLSRADLWTMPERDQERTAEDDQQRTDNPEPDAPADVVRDDGTLSWGVLRVAKRFRNFSPPTGYDGL